MTVSDFVVVVVEESAPEAAGAGVGTTTGTGTKTGACFTAVPSVVVLDSVVVVTFVLSSHATRPRDAVTARIAKIVFMIISLQSN